MTKIIDVSLPYSPRLPTWPGNAPYEFQPVKRLASGDSSNVSRIQLGTHSGTHVDAPRHFLNDGRSVDQLDLAGLVGPCLVAEIPVAPGRMPITPVDLERAVGRAAPERLLLKTPNSRLWSTSDFSPDFAFISPEAARWLVTSGVRLVGIDYLSVEAFRKPGAPTHHVLLSAGVIIIEGLNLAHVEPGRYELVCLPLLLEGSDGAPARAILQTQES